MGLGLRRRVYIIFFIQVSGHVGSIASRTPYISRQRGSVCNTYVWPWRPASGSAEPGTSEKENNLPVGGTGLALEDGSSGDDPEGQGPAASRTSCEEEEKKQMAITSE